VFRFKDMLAARCGQAFNEIAGQVAQTQIKDKSQVFNTARIEALELENLIEVAKATIISANARTESRGAHVRDDDGRIRPEHRLMVGMTPRSG
jgi:succinate dehydrogenase / fumarate reductase flavoprotein subunit